jgi:hypothetical protein
MVIKMKKQILLLAFIGCCLSSAHAQDECVNVALNKPATASASTATEPPSRAFDGNINTNWCAPRNTGWIQVDLQNKFTVNRLNLYVNQAVTGNTVHQILVSEDMVNWKLVETLSGSTTHKQILTVNFNPALSDVRGVRINTTLSTSWVAWDEIEVFSSPSKPIITQNENVLTSSSAINNQWYLNGSAIVGATSQTYTAAIPGSYRVRVSSVNGCVSMSDIVTISTVYNDLIINDNTEVASLTVRPQAQLTIAAGKTLTVTGDLTLESNASGTATLVNNGTLNVTGSTHAQQYLSAKTGSSATNDWWYISSPVGGATAGSILVAESGNMVGYYNEPGANYPQITNAATALATGRGYLAKINTTGTYTFSGTLNDGTLAPITLTRTIAAGGARGFNLVGNPYPSYINWNAITGFGTENVRTDIRPTVWVRTRNNSGNMVFDTFDGQIGTQNGIRGAISNQIAPFQAFWVKVNEDEASPTIQFSNAMRSHQSRTAGNLLKAPSLTEQQIIRVQISNGSNTDETIIATYDAAQNHYDFYDSEKMPINVVSIPEIYTMVDDKNLVINKMQNFQDEHTLRLGARMGQAGEYTIQAIELTNLANWKITLHDNLLSTETELNTESGYTFSIDEATTTTDRFSLKLRSPGIVSSTTDAISSAHIYLNADQHIVISTTGLSVNSPITVYNLAGQVVINSTSTGDHTLLPHNLNTGIYIVKTGHLTQKIVIQ